MIKFLLLLILLVLCWRVALIAVALWLLVAGQPHALGTDGQGSGAAHDADFAVVELRNGHLTGTLHRTVLQDCSVSKVGVSTTRTGWPPVIPLVVRQSVRPGLASVIRMERQAAS